MREVFFNVDGSKGTVSVGRALGLSQRQNYLPTTWALALALAALFIGAVMQPVLPSTTAVMVISIRPKLSGPPIRLRVLRLPGRDRHLKIG
jgi:hypothetical protein